MRMCLIAAFMFVLSGCHRTESQASEPHPNAPKDMQTVTVPNVVSFLLPAGMEYRHGEYPSRYGNQNYNMIRATWPSRDEDAGLLSIDISPSHPKLWRKGLEQHLQNRLRALGTLGPVRQLEPSSKTPELNYAAVEQTVDVASELNSVFRIFRQKSRVVTVAYTAAPSQFDAEFATRVVRRVSNELLIDLPIIRFEKPDLSTTMRTIGTLMVEVPTQWTLYTHRVEYGGVPTETLEFRPPKSSEETPPSLTLSIVHLSTMQDIVEIEATAAFNQFQPAELTNSKHSRATVLDLADDTLVAFRAVNIGEDIITVSYAAPDYLFDTRSAIGLVNLIARSVSSIP